MKELNIAEVISRKRKDKGVTQDELAEYIGVSKASVSKWETGQSYPDVTFLPQLAAYFNISIDELMDYRPQMTKEDIHKLYRRLSMEFTKKPFDAVLEECRQTVKKYYSCFPLLHQMGLIIINHVELAGGQETALALMDEARSLFLRVREESGDANLVKQAVFMEAYCCLAMGEPGTVLELLDGAIVPAMPPESLLSSAYAMLGRTDDAKSVLQVGIYQNIIVLFNFFPAYLSLSADNPKKFEDILSRAFSVAEAFNMKRLSPGVLVGIYLSAAQAYAANGKKDRALDLLSEYAEIVTSDIYPLKLHGDAYFDLLEGWLEKLDRGTDLPRDERTVRQSMLNAVAQNPAFAALFGEPRFLGITEKLKNNCNFDA